MLADRRITLAVLAAGLALLALAVVAARRVLPEWQAGELPPKEELAERFRELSDAAGVELAGGDVRLELSRGHEGGEANPYPVLGAATDDWLLAERRPLFIQATGTGTTAEGLPVYLVAHLGLDGRPWNLAFTRATLAGIFTPLWEEPLPTPTEVLLRPGERLGEPQEGLYNGTAARLHPVLRSDGDTQPPQYVAETALEKSPATFAVRGVGDLGGGQTGRVGDWWSRALGKAVVNFLLFIAVVTLAFVLALGRRIDFVNAALLSLVAAVASVAAALAAPAVSSMEWIERLFLVGMDVVFLLLLWATAESLLRDTVGEATNALDLLRRGRIDRRVGRAILWGLGAGAAVAAVGLLAHALGSAGGALGGLFLPERPSVQLPPFDPGRTPFDAGIRLAGEVLLVVALAYRILPKRWALPVAAVLGMLIRVPASLDFTSLVAQLLVALAVVVLLLATFRRAGSLAVLVAGVAAYLFPTFAFSAQHPAWLGGALGASGLSLLALGALGVLGLARAGVDSATVEAPAFLARIEEERRMRYEMDLLARMQLGLLPDEVPRLPGWQVAARSMLAHEVGGDFYDFLDDADGHLWIAAGDVAGHGSFCSISHAMAKAALASLVTAERTPAEVLVETDRVLRRLGARRIFTSLALIRLDPSTGRALLANAGYPFPLVRGGGGTAGEGTVREIELPGLPLGQGPARSYADVPLELAPGEALVLSSDGLFEALGRDGRPYGFDRYRAGLARLPLGSADQLLEALLAQWREAIGATPLQDDTTVVVVRRQEATAERRITASQAVLA